MHTIQHIATAIAIATAVQLSAADTPMPFPFERIEVDPIFENGYQVSVADINSDGKPDILALSTTPSQLAWYKNPTWERRNITSRIANNIDLAPHDIDGDGDMDIALAAGFNLGNSLQGGEVFWLECPADPLTNQEWDAHRIDAIPTSHRLRWADIDGDGAKELINLPIIGFGARAPEYQAGVLLKAYTVPANPAAQAWDARIIDNTLEMAHGLTVVPSTTPPRDDLLTASFAGVHRHAFDPAANAFSRTHLGAGDQNPRPKQGSSEAGLGRVASGQSFVATVEPWHGNQVVVYMRENAASQPWPRLVIDDSLSDGHALACADLNQDGADEIIAGGRGAPQSLFIYHHDVPTQKWLRYPLDEGSISAAGIFIADINGDHYPDIVSTGTHTQNVVYYQNKRATAVKSARVQ